MLRILSEIQICTVNACDEIHVRSLLSVFLQQPRNYEHGLVILIFHSSPALAVSEASSVGFVGLRTPLSSEIAALLVALTLTPSTADAEQNSRNEEAGKCRPRKGVGIDAELGT